MEQPVGTLIVNVDESSKGKGHLKIRSVKEVEKTSIYVENRDMALGEAKFFYYYWEEILESNIMQSEE